MIRAPAALALAREILKVVAPHTLNESMVQLVGTLIQRRVDVDEIEARTEELRAKVRELSV